MNNAQGWKVIQYGSAAIQPAAWNQIGLHSDPEQTGSIKYVTWVTQLQPRACSSNYTKDEPNLYQNALYLTESSHGFVEVWRFLNTEIFREQLGLTSARITITILQTFVW